MAVSPLRAVGTAFSWLTVLPVPSPADAPDRRVGAAVIRVVPVVGAVLGAVAAGAAFGLSFTDAPSVLVGLLVVGLLAVATRGMHVDGLADTADGLGCFGPPDRVRDVMRGGSSGPFAVATLVVALGVEAACFGALTSESDWYAILFAVAFSRVAAVIACRWTLSPSSPDGFGSLVAGTQRWSIPVWSLLALGTAYPLGWPTLVIVPVVTAAIWGFSAHCARRMGGVNGDVLGACIEVALAMTLVGLVCS